MSGMEDFLDEHQIGTLCSRLLVSGFLESFDPYAFDRVKRRSDTEELFSRILEAGMEVGKRSKKLQEVSTPNWMQGYWEETE